MSTPQLLLAGVALRAFSMERILFHGGFLEASRSRWTPQAGEMPAKRDQDKRTGLKEDLKGVLELPWAAAHYWGLFESWSHIWFPGFALATSLRFVAPPPRGSKQLQDLLCRVGGSSQALFHSRCLDIQNCIRCGDTQACVISLPLQSVGLTSCPQKWQGVGSRHLMSPCMEATKRKEKRSQWGVGVACQFDHRPGAGKLWPVFLWPD